MGNFNFVMDDDEDEEIIEIEVNDNTSEIFSFEEEIPTKRSALSDPEVQAKAQRSRKRSTKAKDYHGKRADGWSYCCAHMKHLSNLCEREQAREGMECSCPCHEERGFSLEDTVRRYEDEEIIDLSA